MKKAKTLLFLIIVFGFFLRVTALSYNPPSLNWDEVSHGYNAYSLLLSGRDEWGELPIFNFRAYGDYPLPLNLYVTIPFIHFLGLDEFSIRLPHAILGTLTILASYFLAKGLLKKEKYALITAFLVAISPWYLFPSRFVLQANLSVFLLTAFFAAFFNRDRKKYLLPLSFFFLGLTLFSYHTTRILAPLILILVLIVYRKEFFSNLLKKKKEYVVSFILILVFFLPLPYVLTRPEARARSSEVFLLNEGTVNKIVEDRLVSEYPPFVTKLIYNRPVYFVKEFSKNYIAYFSPSYLFIKGGTQYQFSLPGKGLLPLSNLAFFYIGLGLLLKRAFEKKMDFVLVAFWLFLAPIPASITIERNAVLRSSAMLPVPSILSALGVFFVWERLKKIKYSRMLAAFYFVTLFVFLAAYLKTYFREYRTEYSWSWQYGYKEAVDYVKQNYEKYDKIIVTKKYGEPHEFFLFYWPWDPGDYRNDENLVRFYQSNWYWVDRFDKFYFANDWDIPAKENEPFRLESGQEFSCKGESCLLITSKDNYPAGWEKVKTVEFLDGSTAFEIYEN